MAAAAGAPDDAALRAVLSALRTLALGSDDSRTELVMSFLVDAVGPADQADPAQAAAKFLNWGALGVVDECCGGGADYRVCSVALRFLALLVRTDLQDEASATSPDCDARTRVIAVLLRSHSAILDYAVDAAAGAPEPLLRCSAIEILASVAETREGCEWLVHCRRCGDFVFRCLLDGSGYVVTAACKLLSGLLLRAEQMADVHAAELLGSLDLPRSLTTMLAGPPHSQTAALEFAWVVGNTKCAAAEAYLARTGLLRCMRELLESADRMVRSRAIDVLGMLLTCTKSPCSLFLQDNGNYLPGAGDVIDTFTALFHNFVLPLACDGNVQQLLTAVDVLQALARLVQLEAPAGVPVVANYLWILSVGLLFVIGSPDEIKPVSIASQRANNQFETLSELFGACKVKTMVEATCKACSREKYRRRLVNGLVEILALATPHLAGQTEIEEATEAVCHILKNELRVGDRKIIKGILACLTMLLERQQIDERIKQTVGSAASNIAAMLLNNACADARVVAGMLEAIQFLFGIEKLGDLFCADNSQSTALASGISLRLFDRNWAVRDTTLEFFSELFEKIPHRITSASRFAVAWEFPKKVAQRIADREPYVRASALKALTGIILHPAGWEAVSPVLLTSSFFSSLGRLDAAPDETLREEETRLDVLLSDTTALVRRAALRFLTSLIAHRGHLDMLFDKGKLLSAKLIHQLLEDDDHEVRTELCKLLGSAWHYSCHSPVDCNALRTQEQTAARRDAAAADYHQHVGCLFFEMDGVCTLGIAARDASRLVRTTARGVLRSIKEDVAGLISGPPQQPGDLPGKFSLKRRLAEVELPRLREFADWLAQADLEDERSSRDCYSQVDDLVSLDERRSYVIALGGRCEMDCE